MIFGSQELSQDEFRASMALARVVESSCTLVAYLALGLFRPASLELFAWLLPAVLVGVPLGRMLLHRLDRERFRRAWITVDLGLICFGLALVLHRLWLGRPGGRGTRARPPWPDSSSEANGSGSG